MPGFYARHCKRYYEDYKKIERFFRQSALRTDILAAASRLLTAVVYLAYIALLAVLAITADMRIIRAAAVPFAVFLITTAVRRGINAPRPYEKYPLTPLVSKSTKGNSCPSRHSACAFAIALCWLYAYPAFGLAMLAVAAAVAALRPVMGVHFPLDVVFGALLALAVSAVGYYCSPN